MLCHKQFEQLIPGTNFNIKSYGGNVTEQKKLKILIRDSKQTTADNLSCLSRTHDIKLSVSIKL